MIKAIFWDNDGVLVDTESLYYQASAETLQARGIELTPAAFAEISLRQGESVFDLAAHLTPVETDQLRLQRNARYSELLQQRSTVIAGVEETLRALHGRVRMAIVTSSRRDHFELIHAASGLLGYFDFVLTREDYRQSKPHPEPYLSALARSGLVADQCLAIEDSERGLTAACRAGLRCLAIPAPLAPLGHFSAAFRILKSVREVPGVIFGRS
ncbi:MAG: HAD family phosphatase [Desulfuromonadales bacterium]|nr:HAD family phosphatase [Desulfuromonadales bacterium]